MQDDLLELAARDKRYSVHAYRFLFESMGEALSLAGKMEADGVERHLTGQELLHGMRVHAENCFGPLAAQVWRSWGIKESLDWGRLVFILVESTLLSKRDEDTVEDFREGFDFDQVFVQDYQIPMPADLA
jgi:uncharacterized repeat protein (TIGR04138 family)